MPNDEQRIGRLGVYAMERVAAGAHTPTPWLFEPAKRPDDRPESAWTVVVESLGQFLGKRRT